MRFLCIEAVRNARRNLSDFTPPNTIVRTNLCVRRQLEIKFIGIRGVEGVAGKDACTVHTRNIICRRQYFVVRTVSAPVISSIRIAYALDSSYP